MTKESTDLYIGSEHGDIVSPKALINVHPGWTRSVNDMLYDIKKKTPKCGLRITGLFAGLVDGVPVIDISYNTDEPSIHKKKYFKQSIRSVVSVYEMILSNECIACSDFVGVNKDGLCNVHTGMVV